MNELRKELELLDLKARIMLLVNTIIDHPDEEERYFDIAQNHGYTDAEVEVVIRLVVLKTKYKYKIEELL